MVAVRDGSASTRGRDLSAWLGLIPRQVSTGGKAKLIGISKRGNCYLRTLFIHGARAVLNRVRDRSMAMTAWADNLRTRIHSNVAAVAVANKLVRIARAVLTRGLPYRPTAGAPP